MSAESAPALLSPAQKRLVGFTLGLAALLLTAAMLALLVWVLGRTVNHFSSVLWPLAGAGILALILRPLAGFIERGLKIRRIFAVALLFGAFILTTFAGLLALTPAVVAQILDLMTAAPELWNAGLKYLEEGFPQWVELGRQQWENPAIREALEGVIAQIRAAALGALPGLRAAGDRLLDLFSMTAGLAIIPVYLFFFLLSDEDPVARLEEHLPFLDDDRRKDVVFLAREFVSIVTAFFRGQILIGLIMGVLLATGFSIAGLRFGLALGLVLGLLNIIPYLGTIIGLSVVLPLAFLQPDGGWWLVGVCLAIFTVVQVFESWFLTPKIMGHSTGLHPVAIIIAIFFWGTALNGVLGMILAIPLTAFFVTAWRLARQKYFQSPAASPPGLRSG